MFYECVQMLVAARLSIAFWYTLGTLIPLVRILACKGSRLQHARATLSCVMYKHNARSRKK